MRRQSWFAIPICVLMTIPGFLIGGIVSTLYRFVATSMIGADPDLFFLRMFFGIETPGLIIQWIFFTGFPAVVQGIVAGVLAIIVTNKIASGANMETAAYSTGTLYTGILVVVMVLAHLGAGLQWTAFQVIAQVIGIWIGLVTTASSSTNHAPAKAT